jgi:hypothetical protein
MRDLAQEQTQPHRATGTVRIVPAIGKTARQQGQFELLIGVGDKAVQMVELDLSPRQVFPPAAALGVDLGKLLIVPGIAVMLDALTS